MAIAILLVLASCSLAYLWFAWAEGSGTGGVDAFGGLVYWFCWGDLSQANGERGRMMDADTHGAFGPSDASGGSVADFLRERAARDE